MAQPRIQKYMVPTAEALDQSLTSYLAQGFIVANRSATSVTLQKKKEFKVVWAIIGFVLCLLPAAHLPDYLRDPARRGDCRNHHFGSGTSPSSVSVTCSDTNFWRVGLLVALWAAYLLYAYGLGSYSPAISFVCPFRWMTELPCPLCGLTRSCSALLHGDLLVALKLNALSPLAVLALPVYAFLTRRCLTRKPFARLT